MPLCNCTVQCEGVKRHCVLTLSPRLRPHCEHSPGRSAGDRTRTRDFRLSHTTFCSKGMNSVWKRWALSHLPDEDDDHTVQLLLWWQLVYQRAQGLWQVRLHLPLHGGNPHHHGNWADRQTDRTKSWVRAGRSTACALEILISVFLDQPGKNKIR